MEEVTVSIPAGIQENVQIHYARTGNKYFDQMVFFAERRKVHKEVSLKKHFLQKEGNHLEYKQF